MSLIAKAYSGDGPATSFKPVPPGMHLARCYRIIDLGTQSSTYQGQPRKSRRLMVQFEVHGEDDQGNALLTDKGEPMTISKNYTLSLGENAALRKDLQSWRGQDFTQDELRGFELKNILGAWAMISVAKNKGNDGNEYTNIVNVNKVPMSTRKLGLPTPHNDLKLFSLSDPDMELFESFGRKLQEKIMSSPEWQGINKARQERVPGSDDDLEQEIPF